MELYILCGVIDWDSFTLNFVVLFCLGSPPAADRNEFTECSNDWQRSSFWWVVCWVLYLPPHAEWSLYLFYSTYLYIQVQYLICLCMFCKYTLIYMCESKFLPKPVQQLFGWKSRLFACFCKWPRAQSAVEDPFVLPVSISAVAQYQRQGQWICFYQKRKNEWTLSAVTGNDMVTSISRTNKWQKPWQKIPLCCSWQL